MSILLETIRLANYPVFTIFARVPFPICDWNQSGIIQLFFFIHKTKIIQEQFKKFKKHADLQHSPFICKLVKFILLLELTKGSFQKYFKINGARKT